MIIGRAAFLALATLAVAAPALAQGGQSGSPGMFNAIRPNSGGRDFLALQMAIRDAFDSDVAPEFRPRLPGGRLPGRRTSIFAGGLGYARNRRAVQFSTMTTGFARYSHELQQAKPGSASARAGLGLRMPGRLGTLSLSQGLSYSPSFLYQLLPGDEIDPDLEPDEPPMPEDPDYRIDARESLAYRTRLRLQTGSGLGWRMVTTGQYARTDFRGNLSVGERRIWDSGTRLSYRPTRRGGISFGYRYRDVSFRTDQTSQIHEVPLGFDFTPSLSATRRLTVRVRVTPTLVNTFTLATIRGDAQPDEEQEAIDIPMPPIEGRAGQRRRQTLQGEAGVSYPINLRWRLLALYQRRVQTVAVVAAPIATDSGRLRLMGTIRRRFDVAVNARHTRGGSVAGIRDGLTTTQGEARLRFALTRSIALSGEYLYFRYDFDGHLLPPDFPQSVERHGVRIGVSLFTRLLGR